MEPQVPQVGPSSGSSCIVNRAMPCGNAGVSKAVVEALEAICKEHEGMEATIRAGAFYTRQLQQRTVIVAALPPSLQPRLSKFHIVGST